MRHIIEIDAPAHWASYLVNGDDSGYTYEECREISMWLHKTPDFVHTCFGITDDEDDSRYGRFDFPLQGYLQCELYTYTFMTEGDAS